MNLIWNSKNTPEELHTILRTLAEEYPVRESGDGVNLTFEKLDIPEKITVKRTENGFTVSYGNPSFAARGIAYALADKECDEKASLSTYGILLDCTRSSVVTVEHFKFWLRRLALFGYNMAMIYVKDAYQLPGEPYFGFMRGAYSMEEMKEIDSYAKKLGIEMIASIQALGHLEPILRWPAYTHVSDTSSCIMADKEESYALIEKMLRFWSEALSSRRIHLGMDETHDLGRGRFMDQNGYENPFDIYNRHLKRVCNICEELNLKPIIWSDMYFRYANKAQEYYDMTATVPEDVKNAIPKMVQLSYWDYYHRDEETYETMLKKTGGLNGCMPFMASGAWTWTRFWTDFEQTAATVKPCIDACRKTGVSDLVLTLWGDDGGYCEFDSVFASLAWAADYAYNTADSEERIAQVFRAVCGTDWKRQIRCGDICWPLNWHGNVVKLYTAALLWDDPLMALTWRELPGLEPDLQEKMLNNYKQIHAEMTPYRDDAAAGRIDYIWNHLEVLIRKLEIRKALEKAYAEKDHAALRLLTEKQIPELLDAIQNYLAVFRSQWKRSYKSFGLELMQIRLSGVAERHRELARVILEHLSDGQPIPELEVKHEPSGQFAGVYAKVATACYYV